MNRQKYCINTFKIPRLKLLIHCLLRLVRYTHEPQGWLHLAINFTNQDIKQTKCKKVLNINGLKFGK